MKNVIQDFNKAEIMHVTVWLGSIWWKYGKLYGPYCNMHNLGFIEILNNVFATNTVYHMTHLI